MKCQGKKLGKMLKIRCDLKNSKVTKRVGFSAEIKVPSKSRRKFDRLWDLFSESFWFDCTLEFNHKKEQKTPGLPFAAICRS